MTDPIERAARRGLGLDDLRPGQREAIGHVVEGRDVLAVMPTGYGKSAIYQIAATLLEGPTLVVSPLIALQRDQVRAIEDANLGGAAEANSTVPEGERDSAMRELHSGDLEFMLVAPERLGSKETLDELRRAKLSLFVVDEAHCISSWGHDFRPDYLRLGAVLHEIDRPRVLALTATAAPPVRDEIVQRLGMVDPVVVVQGFDRPNIDLEVDRVMEDDDKRGVLVELLDAVQPPGIVYAATRSRAEEVAAFLRARGVRCDHYHAGRSARVRHRLQEAFMDDEVDVIVATIAFGMGIDKPNIRFVVHYDVPGSLDSYYQEVGRAGRDGEAARALLLYRPEDLGLRRYFASSSRVREEQLSRVLGVVASAGAIGEHALAKATRLSIRRVRATVDLLRRAGAIDVSPTGDVTRFNGIAGAVEESVRLQDARESLERSRVEMMRGFAEITSCRGRFLLNYFGEELGRPCGHCDNCRAGAAEEEPATGRDFAAGTQVAHREWGRGVVVRREAEALVVVFDEAGYKTLSLELVRSKRLLEPAG